ncbi:hypothetical protein JCM33374_g1288 [Metschnikowia sp. JCM 33374]|nr:hypothetical protein JCM33374_g1288 [Metschnikowia sp. JCM 33374]
MCETCSPLSTELNHPRPKNGIIPSVSSHYDNMIDMDINHQCVSLNSISPNNNTGFQYRLAIPSFPKPRTYSSTASSTDFDSSRLGDLAQHSCNSPLESVSELKVCTYLQSSIQGEAKITSTSSLMKESSGLYHTYLTDSYRETAPVHTWVSSHFPSSFTLEQIGNVEHPNGEKPLPSTDCIEENSTLSFPEHWEVSPYKYHAVPIQIQDPETEFLRFIPFLQYLNSRNLSWFLVQCLKNYHQHIPISGLFHLVYSDKYPDFEFFAEPSSAFAAPTKFSEMDRKGILYCGIIIDTFKEPATRRLLKGTCLENVQVSGIVLHEALRIMLAIKIIFASLIPVQYDHSDDSRVERSSVYKVYYIICQSLIRKHPSAQNYSGIQTLLLGQSVLGKITKLIYPKLISKRLGRRGQSRYNYIGITWNRDTVDVETLKLINLTIPELSKHFTNSSGKEEKKQTFTRHIAPPPIIQKDVPALTEQSSGTYWNVGWETPSYGFVNSASRYPQADCSPRSWQTGINQIPQPSLWVKDNVTRSLHFLRSYNIDLDPLMHNLKSGNFSGGHQISLQSILPRAMATLQISNANTLAFMHLYLAILLLLFPVVVSSEKEVPRYLKLELRSSIQECVLQLEYIIPTLVGAQERGFRAFIGILGSMVHLVDLTMSKIQSDCAELVLRKMIRDLELADDKKDENLSEISSLEKLQVDSVILAMKAFNFKFNGGGPSHDNRDEIGSITAIGKVLVKSIIMTKDTMSIIPTIARSEGLSQVSEDLPYQIFTIGLKFLHEFALADPSIMQLPIPVFNFTLYHVSNLIPCFNFDGFINSHPCHPDLPRESFKCCWVLFSMIQEYLKILSEVVALSAALNHPPKVSK